MLRTLINENNIHIPKESVGFLFWSLGSVRLLETWVVDVVFIALNGVLELDVCLGMGSWLSKWSCMR